MAALAQRRRLFYGWVIVGVGFAAQFLTGISGQAFSTYLVPLGQEFGWNRTTLAGPRSLTQLEGALLGPVDGYLVDRFGPRIVMSAGAVLLGSGMVLFGLVQNVWQYYAVNVVMGLGTSLAGNLVISAAVNSWFRRRRTMAMATTNMGFSLAGIAAVPLVVWMQLEFGWRAAAITSGVAVWCIGIPAAQFLRRSPEVMGLLPDGDRPGDADLPAGGSARHRSPGIDFGLRDALRAPSFWGIGFGNGTNMLIQSAVFVHLFVHLEQGVGLERSTAALAFTFMNVLNIAGRLAGGYLGDRYPKRLLLAGLGVGTASALTLLVFASSIWPVLLFGGIYGFSWGARTPIVNSIAGDYFGRRSYGKILGVLQMVAAPLGISGPLVAGYVADTQGSYRPIFVLFIALALISATIFLFTRPPRAPASLEASATTSA